MDLIGFHWLRHGTSKLSGLLHIFDKLRHTVVVIEQVPADVRKVMSLPDRPIFQLFVK